MSDGFSFASPAEEASARRNAEALGALWLVVRDRRPDWSVVAIAAGDATAAALVPLGERARGNRWSVTITAFTVGAVFGGAAVGSILGGIGSFFAPRTDTALLIIGALALIAGGLDLLGVRALGPARQVNERWIGTLRGSVYGFGFGLQLGSGISTFIVTWGVWVLLVVGMVMESIAAILILAPILAASLALWAKGYAGVGGGFVAGVVAVGLNFWGLGGIPEFSELQQIVEAEMGAAPAGSASVPADSAAAAQP